MKKILSSVAAIALAAALISCGDSGDTNNTITNSDTIISVGTPVVTGKAYPGVNYITWTPVANADHYEVYRTVNNASELVNPRVTGKLEFADYAKGNDDFSLVDGVTYQYTIYAVGANGTNVPSRAVYIATSTASTYVKATVPAYGTDITKFDDQTTKDYLAKLAKGEGVTKPAFIANADGSYNVTVAYPVIPGYKYGVTLVNDDYVAKGISQKKATSFNDVFKGTYTANAKLLAKETGSWTAYLTVAAMSPLYSTSAVYELGKVEIKDIGELSATENLKATYTAEKTVTVTWTPAKLKATGKETATTNYRVFRASSADNYVTLTRIDSDTNKVFVAETETAYQTTRVGNPASITSGIYAINDTVTDNAVTYRYYVVHTDGTLYGKNVETYVERAAYTNTNGTTIEPSLSVTTIKADASHIYDTFKIVATPVNTVRTNNLSKVTEIAYIKLDEDTVSASKSKTYDPSKFTALKLENSNLSDGSYIAYLEAKDGTYIFRAKAEEAGKDAKYSYKTIVMAASVDAGTLTKNYTYWTEVNTTTGAVAYHNVVAVTESASNEIGAYTYEWFYVDTTTVNTNYGDKVTVTTSSLTKVTPVKVTSDSSKALQTVGIGNYGFVFDNTAPTFSGDTVISRQYFVKKSNANNSAVYGIR